MPELPVWQQLQRIGGSLTPLEVSAIIRMADTGRMAGLMDLANEARQKDCHLLSVLATAEESIAGLDWEILPPEDASFKEKKAARFVEAWFKGYRDLRRTLAHHAGAVFYSFSVSEMTWMRDGASLVPEAILPRAHRRFIYGDFDGRLRWYDENGGMAYPGIDIAEAYPDRFIVSQPRVNGDVPCREGLVRPLMWAALFRNWAMSDWLKLGEIAWKPWRRAKYPRNADDNTIDELVAMLEGMSSSGVGAYPDDVQVDIDWPKNAASSGQSMHRELFDVVASEISKAVLGQTLTTEQGRVGALALGQVHNEVRKDLRASRAKAVANDFGRDVVEPMTRMNFGGDVRPPIFRLVTEDAADLTTFSAGIKNLTDSGVRVPVRWIWEQCGIPEPEEGEECVGGAPEEDSADADPNAANPDATDPAAEGDAPPAKPKPKKGRGHGREEDREESARDA